MEKPLLTINGCSYTIVLLLLLFVCWTGELRADETEALKDWQSEGILFNLSFEGHSLEEAFRMIERSSSVKFSYDVKDLDQNIRLTKIFKNESLKNIISYIATLASLDFKRVNNTVNVIKSRKKSGEVASTKEERRVSGTVLDTRGTPVLGASVVEVGTTNGVATNADGRFTLSLITANPKVLISSIGYKSAKAEIGTSDTYEIILQEGSEALDEFVVVGFGEQKKTSLVGSQSTIRPKELKQPVRNLTNTLGGRLAGIVSIQKSGEPGYDGASIFIRGVSTFSSSPRAPLLIVDGVPDREIDNINPEDIESLTVLKDASATAVYGARGANGVIIINTKAGQTGKPRINVEVNQAVTQFTQLPEFVGAVDFMRLYNEGLETRGRNPLYTEERIRRHITGEDPDLYPDVDWFDELFNRYGYNQSANASIHGGTEAIKYYISASYFSETGMFKTNEMKTYDSRLKIERFNFLSNIDIQVTNTTKLELGISGNIINGNYPGTDTDDLFDLATKVPPHVIPPQYSNGLWPRIAGSYSSPYRDLTQSGYVTEYKSTVRSNVRLNQSLDFFTKGLIASIIVSIDTDSWATLKRLRVVPTYFATGRGEDGELLTKLIIAGSDVLWFSRMNGGNKKSYAETAINYNRTFDKHEVSGLLLYYQSDFIDMSSSDLLGAIPYRTRGMSGRLTYGFDHRYFMEINFGYSGSENFSPNKRFGFFPSFGMGWVVSNEAFFEPVRNSISHLKFRYTYGLTGSSNVLKLEDEELRFLFQTRINDLGVGSGYTFGVPGNTKSWQGLEEGQIGSDVTWETARRHNLGIEIGFFDDELSMTTEFFKERRTGILRKLANIPYASGFTDSNLPYGNVGITENKGMDMTLSYNKYFPSSSLFNFITFRGTFTYNQNKNVYDGLPPWKYPWQNKVGHPIDQRFGYVALGLFEDEDDILNSPKQAGDVRPGDIKYQDLNRDGTIDSYDQRAIGYGSIPQILYGLHLGVGVDRFEFTMFFQGTGRSDLMYSGDFAINPFFNGPTNGNLYSQALDRWTLENPNPDAFYPRLSTRQDVTTNYYASTWWLYRSDYIRLKHAEIAYDFGVKKLDKYGMKSLRAYLNGTNLLTFSPWKVWDPELGDGDGTSYPNTTAVNIGLRVSFQ